MARTDDDFARRWSRLKQDDRRRKEKAATEPKDRSRTKESALPVAGDASATPPDLPEIDSLDKDSDFSVFLRDGVPEELKRLALRKLWRTDPVFAVIDGLDDYDDDYRTAFVVAERLAKLAAKADKGKIAKEAETTARETEAEAGDRPAEARTEASAQAPQQGKQKTSSADVDKDGEETTEPKRDDDADMG